MYNVVAVGKRARELRIRTLNRLHAWVATQTDAYEWLTSERVMRVHGLVPSLPRLVAKHLGTRGDDSPRSLAIPELPRDLRTYPGILRNREAEERAFKELGPLPLWTELHHEATKASKQRQWLAHIFTFPRVNRMTRRLVRVRQRQRIPDKVDPADLTRRVKAKAAEIGLSAVGIAKRDPLITFAPYQDDVPDGDNVIVCLAEQHWGATQTIPSFRGLMAALDSNMLEFPGLLAMYLRELGYVANVWSEHGMSIAYAVEAGLGQLGLNGQLLTPFAGSRARIRIITTDAPLVLDHPVDYGVPAICDKCQACVRNCPTGAIRSKREWHRGVYKAKIKTERCLPMMVQAHACAVCMKVCPVQRYGLPAVIEEYKESGRIKGRDSHELEGYTWPIDGRYYGPGEKPREAVNMLTPPGYVFDPDRTIATDKRSTPNKRSGQSELM